jgi:alcohol dehydrogenase class IV
MTVTWTFPTRIHFGEGSIEELGREATRLGAKHALIVSDRSVAEAGLASLAGRALDLAGVAFTIFEGVGANATAAQVDRASEAYRGAHADLVVAVGSGGAIDVAKLLRVRVTHDVALADLDGDGAARIHGALPPLLAVPTTAGSGASSTSSSAAGSSSARPGCSRRSPCSTRA